MEQVPMAYYSNSYTRAGEEASIYIVAFLEGITDHQMITTHRPCRLNSDVECILSNTMKS